MNDIKIKKSKSSRNKKLIFFVILIGFLICAYVFFKQAEEKYNNITNFEECVLAGYKILTTYPEQCKVPGKVFVNKNQISSIDIVKASTTKQININPKNTSYDIEGNLVTLLDGYATSTNHNDNSSSTNIIEYFGNELRVDIDSDGKEDTAFLVTYKTNSNTISYYLVIAIKKDTKYTGTNGVLIGDRIIPKSIEFRNGKIVVNYLDRKVDESMKTKPSVLISRYFKVNNNTIIEISK